ncbi:hypothetical protein Q1695_002382 [Nippostrongylus brasiliensis]|nr:hypothetical protein Q1695_002382 [Nippostrongylus brasiliensis]
MASGRQTASGVVQHDGTLTVNEFARKTAFRYDSKGIQQPFSIIDLDVVKRQLDIWRRALPSVKPYYAVKCNPDLNILRTLSAHGACFDCASLEEMRLVLSHGFATSADIVLAHPVKSEQCIHFALEHGITAMTLDSVEELRKIAEITTDAKLILRIKVTGFDSLVDLNKKFGADEMTSKLILHEAAKLGVKIHGISFHIGSGVENCHPMAASLKSARKLMDYGQLLGHPISTLDIGGGFMPTTLQKFMKVGHFIENTLSSCFDGVPLTVIAEPGRFFVTDAQYVVTSISQVIQKSLNADLPTSYNVFINDGVYGTFNFVLTEQRKVEGAPLLKRDGFMRADIWGPTCCSFDLIETDRRISTVEIGDWMIYPQCGAYSTCLSTHFNGFAPPTIFYLISANNWCDRISFI